MIFSRLTFIYIASVLFIYCVMSQNRGYKNYYKRVPSFINERREILYDELGEKVYTELIVSYVTSEKRRLPKKIKKYHRDLNLYHLFTPSGIHLSSVYLFLFPLFYYIKRKSSMMHFIVNSIICLIPFFFGSYYSIKRISSYRLAKQIHNRYLKFKIPNYFLFLIVFIIDFFVGTYSSSPMSFVFSFLFLGIIFSICDSENKIVLPFALLGGQVIISYFMGTHLTYLGFLFGFLLTALFSFVFPIFLFYFFIPWIVPKFFLKSLMTVWYNLLVYCGKIVENSGYYYSNIPLILAVILLSMRINAKYKKYALIVLLVISSDPIMNLEYRQILKKKSDYNIERVPFEEVKSMKLLSKTIRVKTITNRTCRFRLFEGFYATSCK